MASAPPLVIVLRVKRRRDGDGGDEVIHVAAPTAKAPRVTGGRASASSLIDSLQSLSVLADGAPPPPPAPLRFRRVARAEDLEAHGERPSRRLGTALLQRLPSLKGSRAATSHPPPLGAAARSASQRAARVQAHRAAYGTAPDAPTADRDSGGGEGVLEEESTPADGVRMRFFDVEAGGVEPAAVPPGEELVFLRRRWLGARDRMGIEDRVLFVPLARPVPNRILNPLERVMDEAVWRAFKACDFEGVLTAMDASAGGAGELAHINYQRVQSDLTTALMAASFHGNARIASALVRHGALVRVTDASGRAAVDYAVAGGHAGLADLLRDVLAEEENELAEWTGAPTSRAGSGLSAPSSAASYDYYMLEDGVSEDCSAGGDSTRLLRLTADDHGIAAQHNEDARGSDGEEWDEGWHAARGEGADESDTDSEDADGVEVDYPEDESEGGEGHERRRAADSGAAVGMRGASDDDDDDSESDVSSSDSDE